MECRILEVDEIIMIGVASNFGINQVISTLKQIPKTEMTLLIR